MTNREQFFFECDFENGLLSLTEWEALIEPVEY